MAEGEFGVFDPSKPIEEDAAAVFHSFQAGLDELRSRGLGELRCRSRLLARWRGPELVFTAAGKQLLAHGAG